MTDDDSLRRQLKAAIAETPGVTATSLAREIGRGGTYLRDYFKGKKETIGAREIAAIEARLGRSLGGGGQANGTAQQAAKAQEPESPGHYRPPPQFMNAYDPIPVYASAEGGEGHIIVSHDEIGRAPRPQVLENVKGAYAILITGVSMIPAYKPGDRAWVNPVLSPLPETDCIFYAIEEGGEAKATIKELVTWTDKHWTVRQHNPAKTFKLDRALWTTHHRVVGNFRRR